MMEEALKSLRKGEIVLVFDAANRERETDMILAAEHVTPEHIRILRNDAGGLICAPVSAENAEKLGIPFMTDILKVSSEKYPVLKRLSPHDIPYDEKSAFSITVNHRKTFTGITDNDRALTIKELALLCKDGQHEKFGDFFRSPGHVTLLRAADGHVLRRRGHTEMSIALMEMAGLTGVAVCCEMMDNRRGNSLSTEDARLYAKEHDLIFLNGSDLIKAYKEYKFEL
ncbi:MAG TPA: 3,4-dihydroxy-2-butanone-4-phosphate synthase [Methanothermobacter sp.]|uniref:3,4-dihydroxy-2-butanone 4-phosphate synthase n=1 Tax=Methanothermobacter tenebrarum TaxID=680118 RepID=A0ABN6PB79_9EURY|nr:3,4-dihydroxy-2-butanone-4-phosphate synthase [Methanothermobacter tenebrarum]BDH78694.1 3,4-dihydroxy-2-butanone-4-phosphate synthase [Methanothermobacter tenebrarum]HHW16295.1 3,4-dihydroxy-2-butanone-4-phosphate synthase [Methanothermobacter sp.]HOQ19610.1 3,4-dihydroxy-2-butanone-4-phosphate synthase [Methanothermobacter sp.]